MAKQTSEKRSNIADTAAQTEKPRGRIFDKETGDTFADIQKNLSAVGTGEQGEESAD